MELAQVGSHKSLLWKRKEARGEGRFEAMKPMKRGKEDHLVERTQR